MQNNDQEILSMTVSDVCSRPAREQDARPFRTSKQNATEQSPKKDEPMNMEEGNKQASANFKLIRP